MPVKRSEVRSRLAANAHSKTLNSGDSTPNGVTPKKHDLTVISIPIQSLKLFPSNPRIGDVAAVALSLKENGQFKPIVVQKGTNYILAGSHTWRGAKRLGWSHIDGVVLDVNKQEATRINLADNRTGELGTYNMDLLAKQLASLPNLTGTGYKPEDMDKITAAVKDGAKVDAVALMRPSTLMDDHVIMDFNDGLDGVDLDQHQPGEEDNRLGEDPLDPHSFDFDLELSNEELPGSFQLKDEIRFPGAGYWGLPKIRDDMLMMPEDMPDNLIAWAGSAHKDWPDENQWWLYNYGIDSTSGMLDQTKMILSFYTFDNYFDTWWLYPGRNVSKALNTGIKYAVGPNFTPDSLDPHVVNLMQTFKSRWLTRYMQDAGIKMIPDICWPSDDLHYVQKYLLAGIPKPCRLIAIEMQTFDKRNITPDNPHVVTYNKILDHIFTELQPEMLLLYAGVPGGQYVRKCLDRLGHKCEVVWVDLRTNHLHKTWAQKERKETL